MVPRSREVVLMTPAPVVLAHDLILDGVPEGA